MAVHTCASREDHRAQSGRYGVQSGVPTSWFRRVEAAPTIPAGYQEDDSVLGPLLFFAVVWNLAWRRYNSADGTLADLLIWLSVGAVVYLTAAWLITR